jgi:hypothetical protein
MKPYAALKPHYSSWGVWHWGFVLSRIFRLHYSRSMNGGALKKHLRPVLKGGTASSAFNDLLANP